MSSFEYNELPVLAGYMLGAGIATFDHVARIFCTTPSSLVVLARDARIRLGDITSFQKWIMRSPARSAAWRGLHHALRGVRFGEPFP